MTPPLPPARSPKAVTVVGAGVAGLTCAVALAEAGHRVTVLEARDRPGGRVRTLRPPLPAGLRAEIGAAFLPDNHPLPLQYAAALGLRLVPVPSAGLRPRYRVAGAAVTDDWPARLHPDERGLDPGALLARAVRGAVGREGGWPPVDGDPGAWGRFDHVTFDELLRREGLSDGARALVGLTLVGNLGDGPGTISALAGVRQLAHLAGRGRTYAIEGGNDRLPRALAGRLGGRVRYGVAVAGVARDAAGVTVRAGDGTEVRADRAVLALPTPALARLAAAPGWGEGLRAAIARQRWTPIARVFLAVARRFWPAGHPLLLGSSDRPAVRWLGFDDPDGGGRGVLTAYVVGSSARELAGAAPADRVGWAREEAAALFPEWDGATTAEADYSWDADPLAGGGYPWPGVGDDGLPAALAAADGRVHFAGDHTTHQFGWLQGAMASGLRAAREVHDAP